MSPLLKAISIGIAVFATSLLIMWGTSRLMSRPFFPRFPRAPVLRATPTPAPPLFPTL